MATNVMRRCFPQLSQAQKDELLEWEAMLREPADAQRLAFQPEIERQMGNFLLLLEQRGDFLASLFEAHAAKSDKDLKFGKKCHAPLLSTTVPSAEGRAS